MSRFQGQRVADKRVVGVDVARGVALVGMMSVHVLPAFDDDGGSSTSYLLASGRAAALFALLAGVGLALVSGGTHPLSGRRYARVSVAVVVRAALIGLLGLALGALDPPVLVILAYYAVLFVVAVPFLRLRAPALAACAVGAAVVCPLASYALRRGDDETVPTSQPDLSSLADPIALLETLVLTGTYPVLPWTAYLLAGLAIGRCDLRAVRTAWVLLLGGAVLALTAWLVSSWLLGSGGLDRLVEAGPPGPFAGQTVAELQRESFYGTTPTTTPWWLVPASPHSSTTFDLLHTIGTSAAVLGAALLVTRSIVGRIALTPLAAAGSMTLTLYSLHVVALDSEWGPEDTTALFLLHVVLALLLATAWRAVFARGPLEQVVTRTSTWASRTVVPDRRATTRQRHDVPA